MHAFDPLGSDLIFLISLPRSGSTLLQRILAGHSEVASVAEPWLMLHPLYALKDKGIEAEYDANLARQGVEDFLQQVDGGEDTYIDGVRAFANTLYARALKGQNKRVFLDKTPRYYRIIPELYRVYPKAKFVFLIRNPLAVLASTLSTWFDDDPQRLLNTSNHHDLLEGPHLLVEGIKALGEDAIVVNYEMLVEEPDRIVRELCERLDIDFEPAMLEYGRQAALPGRFGDQVGINQHNRTTSAYRDKWMNYFHEQRLVPFAMEYLVQLDPATLVTLGYDPESIRKPLIEPRQPQANRLNSSAETLLADRLNLEGEVLYQQGDSVGAQLKFDAAIEADPTFPTSYNNLIVLYWERGEIEQALSHIATGLEQAPEDRLLLENSAQVLEALGLHSEASAIYKRYNERHTDVFRAPVTLESDGALGATTESTQGQSVAESPVSVSDQSKDTFANSLPSKGMRSSAAMNDLPDIVIATSIAPRGIEKQQRAISSWLSLGFRVASLNTREEIGQLEIHFPQVQFVEVKRNGQSLAGKPFVFLDDILDYLRNLRDTETCGIVNSDIVLRGDRHIIDYLSMQARNSLVYGSRVDIQSADDTQGCLYHRGFDYFFFNRDIIRKLPRSQFMLGVPWWDYWLPVGFSRAGVPIKRLENLIAYHIWHPTNYSTQILIDFAREFVERCSGIEFLHLHEQCVKSGFGNVRFSVLSDAALDHLNRVSDKLTLFTSQSADSLLGAEPKKKPRITAIVSTYKSGAFIGECLADLVGQSVADQLEIVVIDAASPEQEGKVVEDYQRRYPSIPIRYQRTDSRIGVYAAWNQAARLATGDYLISCSTNDRLRQDALEILSRTLDEHPEVELVYGNSFMSKVPHQSFEAATLCGLYLWSDYRYEDLIDRCMVGPHPMWRRRVHDEVGYFDESYVALGDQDFWLRLGEQKQLMNIPDFTGVYYVSESSLTGDGDVAALETERAHIQYQWRYRYPRWQSAYAQRYTVPLHDSEVMPSLHVMLLIAPGKLASAADSLDDLGLQDCPNMQVTLFADQPPPDPQIIQEGGLGWVCYQDPTQIPDLLLEAARHSEADWLCLMDAGDRLTSAALRDAARYAIKNPAWQMIYCDNDYTEEHYPQYLPRFKPDFNLNLLRSNPYIGGFVLARAVAFVEVEGVASAADWRGSDLALRICDQYGEHAVGHIASILTHRAVFNEKAWTQLPDAAGYREAVAHHLVRRNIHADVIDGLSDSTLHIQHNRSDYSTVTVVLVATGKSLDVIRSALRNLIEKTTYPNFDVLVIASETVKDPAWLEAILPSGSSTVPVQWLKCEAKTPGELLNTAAVTASGEFLIYLDAQCRVLQSNWVERFLAPTCEPDVGIVGARLITPKKGVLDTGLLLGLGGRDVGLHANMGLHMTSPGYLGRALAVQDMSAVNGLCVLIRKKTFTEAGGFSPRILTGLYSDIDFCLKAKAEGWRILWTPAVTLMYQGRLEEADRPPEDLKTVHAENTYMLKLWSDKLAADASYNRNLDYYRSDFQVETAVVPSWDPVIDSELRIIGFGVGSYGSWQYRGIQPLTALHDARQARCVIAPFPKDKPRPLPTLASFSHMQPDTLLMHNTLHDDYLEALEKYKTHSRVFVVFGQDDLMFALPPKNPFSKTVYRDIKKRVRRCIELSDRVVVTTEPLADALKKYSAEVRVIPNYLCKAPWMDLHSARRQGDKPRVGWAGAQQHGGDLELLVDVVKATADEVDWVFLGMCPAELLPFIKELHQPVPFAEYPAKLASLNLDLAVAPLERNQFNEAKSNLRLLEYGALGWPVIASDIHPYQNSPVCRVPNMTDAWVRAIRERVNDLDAVARDGDQLRDWVQRNWMIEDRLNLWLDALRPEAKKTNAGAVKNIVSI